VTARTATRGGRALYLELCALGAEFEVYRDPDGPLGLSGSVRLPPGDFELLEERIHAVGEGLLTEILLHGFSGLVRDEDARAVAAEARAGVVGEERA
jgi:hypothetical protein